MSDRQTSVLRILRVFGPCSNIEVAQRLEITGKQCYDTMYIMHIAGLVDHVGEGLWDVSRRGREQFDKTLVMVPQSSLFGGSS